jgi:hypothetical protein
MRMPAAAQAKLVEQVGKVPSTWTALMIKENQKRKYLKKSECVEGVYFGGTGKFKINF